jgi:hypothetical protein
MGGHTATLIRTFGTTDVAGVPLRLVGAYQADDGSPPQSVEIYLGGRFTEIDLGKSKAGDDTEHKYTLPLSYYRRVVDGVDEVEIDMLGPVPRRRRRSLCRDHGHPDRVIGPHPKGRISGSFYSDLALLRPSSGSSHNDTIASRPYANAPPPGSRQVRGGSPWPPRTDWR